MKIVHTIRFALLLLLLSGGAQADIINALVLPSGCGSIAYTGLPFGSPGQVTIDAATGKICTDATVTATSSINAVAALPTLAPGAQAPQGSLAGAAYVQPVFSSTAGGGTQVDATHGLPVAILAGSAVMGHVITDTTSTTAATQATVDAFITVV